MPAKRSCRVTNDGSADLIDVESRRCRTWRGRWVYGADWRRKMLFRIVATSNTRHSAISEARCGAVCQLKSCQSHLKRLVISEWPWRLLKVIWNGATPYVIYYFHLVAWRSGYRRSSNERSYPTSGPVSTWMGDRLWASIPSRHVRNQPTTSTQPCIPPASLNRVPASAGVKAGMSAVPGGR